MSNRNKARRTGGNVGEPDGGEKPGSKNKAKEAGVAVAIVGAVAAICVAGINSGAYAKICPAVFCGPASPAASPAAPTAPSSGGPGQQPIDTPGPGGGGPTAQGLPGGGRPGGIPDGEAVATGMPQHGETTLPTQGIQKAAPPATSPRHEPRPIGDFSVSLLQDYGCIVRSGEAGAWDIDIWYTVNWVSPDNHPMPTGNLRVTTDLERSKDWSLRSLGSPGGYLDTFVDKDDRYLGRFVTVKATILPDAEVPESSVANNSLTLSVDLRGGLPPAGTNLRVPCSKT